MKRLWILFAMVLLVLPCVSRAGMLDEIQGGLVYARSFKHPDEKTSLAKVAFPVKDWVIDKNEDPDKEKTLTLNADLLGFIEEADLGLGASLSINNLVGQLTGGIGYVPHGFGLSWYIGFKF